MQIDLRNLPTRTWYEDSYQGWVDIFKEIAHTPAEQEIKVNKPPFSWVPLLLYLKCQVYSPRIHFDHCRMVAAALMVEGAEEHFDRTAIEVLCNFRPETADCLWKVDMEWDVPPGRVLSFPDKKEFIVTTNGAYHRPEVLRYLKTLKDYEPTKKKVVLLPCAADKPYPSPLHQDVINLLKELNLRDEFYIMNATGVLGLVPEDLWPIMPHYDSGIPNEWRLFKIAGSYFDKFAHDEIVVYLDYYAHTLHIALNWATYDAANFPLGAHERNNYEDLRSPENLEKLRQCLTLTG